jgi:hypothetical protein
MPGGETGLTIIEKASAALPSRSTPAIYFERPERIASDSSFEVSKRTLSPFFAFERSLSVTVAHR